MSTTTPSFTISTPDAVQKMNALVFGPPKQGKTTFVSTAQDDPRTSPILIIDWEGGVSAIADRSDIHVVRVRKWEDFAEIRTWLLSGDHPYRSVILDSISEAHISALMKLLDADKRRAIPDLLDPGDYGQALVQMRRLLRDFRDLPLHFFATALSKSDVDPQIGTILKPSLVGGLADEAPGIFDCVMYLATQDIPSTTGMQTQRVLVLKGIPKFRTGIRLPRTVVAPDTIEDPTIGKFLDAVGMKSR